MATSKKYGKIDPAFKARWLTALRSGDYKQAEGALREGLDSRHKSFCCLGVACDLVDSSGWRKEVIDRDGTTWGWHDASPIDQGVEHFPQLEGITQEGIDCLVSLNDDMFGPFGDKQHRVTFTDIASWIKKNL